MTIVVLSISNSEQEARCIREHFPKDVTVINAGSTKQATELVHTSPPLNLIVIGNEIGDAQHQLIAEQLQLDAHTRCIPICRLDTTPNNQVVRLEQPLAPKHILQFLGNWQEDDTYSHNFSKVGAFLFTHNKQLQQEYRSKLH